MIVGIASADHRRADRSPDGIEHWGGAGWARVGQYLPYIAKEYEIVVGILWKEHDGMHIEDANHVKIRPDVLIVQRILHDKVDEAFRWGQSHGQYVISDVDDWYWGIDPRNGAFNATHPKMNLTENTTFYSRSVAASDLITVSTPYLAERLGNRVDCPIKLIRNYVDIARFDTVVQQVQPTLGWAGSTGHRSGDLETMRGILGAFVDRGDYRLHHSGHVEGGNTFGDRVGVDQNKITTTPLCTATDYPRLLTFDVGIVPLRDTPFNHAKSAIKGLEYAAAGIPFVAQALPSYQELFDSWASPFGSGFFVAKRPKDWIRYLNMLRDYDFRLEEQAALLDRVQSYDIHFGAQQWLNILERLR